MPGVFPHIIVAAIQAAIVLVVFRRKDYAISIFTGNILPDVLGGAYAAAVIGSAHPSDVLASDAWQSIQKDQVMQSFWIFIQASLVLAYFFYHVHIRKKKPHHEMEGNIAMLLIGYLTHMGMDMFIKEEGVWY